MARMTREEVYDQELEEVKALTNYEKRELVKNFAPEWFCEWFGKEAKIQFDNCHLQTIVEYENEENWVNQNICRFSLDLSKFDYSELESHIVTQQLHRG